MTWQELADFINNEMPECNRNQDVTVWDAGYYGYTGGKFTTIHTISPFDEYENPNGDNFYSMNINTDCANVWW